MRCRATCRVVGADPPACPTAPVLSSVGEAAMDSADDEAVDMGDEEAQSSADGYPLE